MSLYTRTGDDGKTGLCGGGRIEKDSERMHAVGDVDELNAALGAICDESLQPLQSLMFELGADLAAPSENESVGRIKQSDIDNIEAWIDQVDGTNEPLRTFVLPGGSETASRLHLARAVCRRAERSVTTLHRSGECSTKTLILLNRISDLLFAMARASNKQTGVADIPWLPQSEDNA
jgi:cob(I)alamin adenosyltransferase